LQIRKDYLSLEKQIKSTGIMIITDNNKTTKANINQFLNLKFHIVESLRSQKLRENWTYPTLKSTGIHEIHFSK